MSASDTYWDKKAGPRLRRRTLIGSALGATGAAALGACGSSPAREAGQQTAGSPSAGGSGTPQAGGTLAVAQSTNPPTFDPQRVTSFYTLLPSGAVYSRLLRFKTGTDPKVAENHDVEGDLALSVESPDAVTWTVKLRPDAKFHNVAPVNGHPVEAEDIKAAFTRALGKDNPARGSLDMISEEGIETPDKTTVVFKLNYAYAPFQSTLASPNYSWIFPREALGSAYDPGKLPIGSGPFAFDSYTPDVAMTFKKNPEWFSKPMPYADSLRWAIIPDATQQRAQFTGGNLDLFGSEGTYAISTFDVEGLKKDNPKALLTKGNPTAGQVIFVQLAADSGSPFLDVRLRRAFSLGIDRAAISKAIYNNDAVAQWYVPLGLGKWAMRQDQLPADTAQFYKYDPAESKKLLQASGMADQQFKLIYATGFLGPAYEQAAQTAANMLSSAGIKVTAVAVDYTKDYIGGGKGIRYGNFDKNSLVFTGLSQYADADDYLYNYYHSKGTSSLSHLNDPQVDAMIGKARTIVNVDERVNAYLAVQKYLADKVYSVAGMSLPYRYTMAGPRVQNYQPGIGYGIATETFAKIGLKS
jgi:peptide/nickel transport system substrate-binding protein